MKIEHQLILVISLIISCLSLQCKNGEYSEQFDICQCLPGFIGKECDISSIELKSTDVNITITKQYTYCHYDPQQLEQFRFLLQFCQVDTNKALDLGIYFQVESADNSFNDNRNNQIRAIHTLLNGTNICGQLLQRNGITLSNYRKRNGKLPKIIIGFKIGILTPYLQTRNLMVQFNVAQIISFGIFINFFYSLLIIIFVGVCTSLLIVCKNKIYQMVTKRKQQKQRIKQINMITPEIKFQELLQQNEEGDEQKGQRKLQCSICLCFFDHKQKIRRTPCNHIFHSSCLESWCKDHLNCPICRHKFQYQEQNNWNISNCRQLVQTNIREDMLQNN